MASSQFSPVMPLPHNDMATGTASASTSTLGREPLPPMSPKRFSVMDDRRFSGMDLPGPSRRGSGPSSARASLTQWTAGVQKPLAFAAIADASIRSKRLHIQDAISRKIAKDSCSPLQDGTSIPLEDEGELLRAIEMQFDELRASLTAKVEAMQSYVLGAVAGHAQLSRSKESNKDVQAVDEGASSFANQGEQLSRQVSSDLVQPALGTAPTMAFVPATSVAVVESSRLSLGEPPVAPLGEPPALGHQEETTESKLLTDNLAASEKVSLQSVSQVLPGQNSDDNEDLDPCQEKIRPDDWQPTDMRLATIKSGRISEEPADESQKATIDEPTMDIAPICSVRSIASKAGTNDVDMVKMLSSPLAIGENGKLSKYLDPVRTLSKCDDPKPTSFLSMMTDGYESCLDHFTDDVQAQFDVLMDDLLSDDPFRAVQRDFQFKYKSRTCNGKAIHICSLHRDGAEVIETLVSMGADANLGFTFEAFGKIATAQPVHLAAGAGNIQVLHELVRFDGDVNIKSRHGPKANLAPIHDAAYFDQADAVAFLLEARADILSTNSQSMSALHVAAKIGSSDTVDALIEGSSDIDGVDREGRTALMVAVEAGVYPPRFYYKLAKCDVSDVLFLAGVHPAAACELLDRYRETENASKDKSWQREKKVQEGSSRHFVEKFEVNDFVHFMDVAPEVADALMKALTVEPDVSSAFHHPLYTRARIPAQIPMKCHYNKDVMWTSDTQGAGKHPAWHDELAPGGGDPTWQKRVSEAQQAKSANEGKIPSTPKKEASGLLGKSVSSNLKRAPTTMMASGTTAMVAAATKVTKLGNASSETKLQKLARKDLVPIEIQVLKMRGIVCPSVLHALAYTQYISIFDATAVHAILQYLWVSFVRAMFTAQLFARVAEISLMGAWTLSNGSEVLWPFCWSAIWVFTMRDLVRAGCFMYGYVVTLRRPSSYFFRVRYLADLVSIVFFMSFLVNTYHGRNGNDFPRTLACVALRRWSQLIFNLRAYTYQDIGFGLGLKIMPILQALNDTTGVVVVLIPTFLAFLHAFTIIYGKSMRESAEVLLVTFKLGFLSEADGGIDPLLTFTKRDDPDYNPDATPEGSWFTWICALGISTVMCICLMNILIAVLMEAYTTAYKNKMRSFLQEHARICLDNMLLPTISCGCFGRHSKRLFHADTSDSEDALEDKGRLQLCAMSSYRWCLRRPAVMSSFIMGAATVTWISLLIVKTVHVLIPSIIGLLAVCTCESLVVQRPWLGSSREKYLWWCHRSDDVD